MEKQRVAEWRTGFFKTPCPYPRLLTVCLILTLGSANAFAQDERGLTVLEVELIGSRIRSSDYEQRIRNFRQLMESEPSVEYGEVLGSEWRCAPHSVLDPMECFWAHRIRFQHSAESADDAETIIQNAWRSAPRQDANNLPTRSELDLDISEQLFLALASDPQIQDILNGDAPYNAPQFPPVLQYPDGRQVRPYDSRYEGDEDVYLLYASHFAFSDLEYDLTVEEIDLTRARESEIEGESVIFTIENCSPFDQTRTITRADEVERVLSETTVINVEVVEEGTWSVGLTVAAEAAAGDISKLSSTLAVSVGGTVRSTDSTQTTVSREATERREFTDSREITVPAWSWRREIVDVLQRRTSIPFVGTVRYSGNYRPVNVVQARSREGGAIQTTGLSVEEEERQPRAMEEIAARLTDTEFENRHRYEGWIENYRVETRNIRIEGEQFHEGDLRCPNAPSRRGNRRARR